MNLIMLHGSRGTYQELLPLAKILAPACTAILPNLIGHGGREIPDTFSVRAFAEDIVRQMDQHHLDKSFIFGYSFGGYVALYLARFFPDRIYGVCSLATKVQFDAETVKLWTKLSSIERVRQLQTDQMNQRHPGQNWDRLVSGLSRLYVQLGSKPELGPDDWPLIEAPVLVMSADADQLVPWEESLSLSLTLPRGQGFTFSGQAHPFAAIPPVFLAGVIKRWLGSIVDYMQTQSCQTRC